MFTVEQKRLADAQVSFLTETILHQRGKRGPDLAQMLGLPYSEYRELVWSNQPGEGKVERLAEMTRAVRGEP